MPKKPPLLERPGDGNYSRYDGYSHAEYRDYEEGRSFSHDRRSGPPHRGVRKVILLKLFMIFILALMLEY